MAIKMLNLIYDALKIFSGICDLRKYTNLFRKDKGILIVYMVYFFKETFKSVLKMIHSWLIKQNIIKLKQYIIYEEQINVYNE